MVFKNWFNWELFISDCINLIFLGSFDKLVISIGFRFFFLFFDFFNSTKRSSMIIDFSSESLLFDSDILRCFRHDFTFYNDLFFHFGKIGSIYFGRVFHYKSSDFLFTRRLGIRSFIEIEGKVTF